MRPKRALLVTSNFPRWSGDETTPFVLNLAADLEAEGWMIDVLAPHAPDAKKTEIIDGVTVRRFRYLFPESQQTVCYGGGALINLRESRMNWIKVPLLVLTELIATLRILATRRYSIVNAHWILPQGFVAAIAGRLTRTPVVTTVHGGDVFDLRGGLLSRFKRWSLRGAHMVTANSSATEDATRGIYPDAAIRRIPMGVDLPERDDDKIAAIAATHRHGAGPLIIFVGRLVIEKGIDDLLHAMAIRSEELADATLLVVGAGQDQSELEELRDELSLGTSVTFAGWVPPAEIPSYLAAADMFAGPSKQSASGWKEGLGLVFLEAMAAGTPVIATASGGITDIVHDGETGLLVTENSPKEIAAAILRLHTDPELGARLVDNGRNRIRDTFTRTASAAAFAELFDQIRASGASPG